MGSEPARPHLFRFLWFIVEFVVGHGACDADEKSNEAS